MVAQKMQAEPLPGVGQVRDVCANVESVSSFGSRNLREPEVRPSQPQRVRLLVCCCDWVRGRLSAVNARLSTGKPRSELRRKQESGSNKCSDDTWRAQTLETLMNWRSDSCFTKCWGEVKDDLDRVTPQSQEGLCTEIKLNKKRRSRTVLLKENPLSSPRGIERKTCTSSVNRNAIAAIFGRDTGASYRG